MDVRKMKVKYLIRDVLKSILGTKVYIKTRFLITHGYDCDFSTPKTWNEKIQFRKLNTEPSVFANFVDKYSVREYVKKTIGEEFLIPLYAKTNALNEDFIDKLPEKFVLKTSNGGGGVNVKVVDNKANIDVNTIISDFNSAVSEKIGSKIDEPFYDVIKASILAEGLIENEDGSPLLDYKFHMFNNSNPPRMLLQINSEYNSENETKTLYEIDGVKSGIQFSGYNLGPDKITLPINFNKMIKVASLLSKPFNYVRIDLYNVNGNIYFGEITFCPASGWDKLNNKENDYLLGSWWI